MLKDNLYVKTHKTQLFIMIMLYVHLLDFTFNINFYYWNLKIPFKLVLFKLKLFFIL